MMQHNGVGFRPRGGALPQLRRQRRTIEVRVISGGHEVDSFAVSERQTLRAAVRPILAHLPAADADVQFKAVEEEWLPLGLSRSRREADLPSLDDALLFLAA
jgi:hypothetical protein